MPSTEVYAAAADIRPQINSTSTSADAVLDFLASVASRTIDGVCNRPDGFTALAVGTARQYPGSGRVTQEIDECISVSLVEVKRSPSDTTWENLAAADWIAATGDPQKPDFNTLPYTMLVINPSGSESHFPSGRSGAAWPWEPHPDDFRGREATAVPTVRTTARWGRAATTPPAAKQATIILSARWYKRGQSSWGDVLANVDVGQLQFNPSTDQDVLFILRQARLIRPSSSR